MYTSQTFIRMALMLCCLWGYQSLQSQPYSTATPQNLDQVIGEIYHHYGGDIKVTPDQMLAYLAERLIGYNADLPVPEAEVVKNTGNAILFGWQPMADLEYSVSAFNTGNAEQETHLVSGGEYAFNSLNSKSLYLFTIAARFENNTSGLCVTVGRLGFIIIIDDKILYGLDQCDNYNTVSSGNNLVTVPHSAGSSDFFRISVSACGIPAVTPDTMILRIDNSGTGFDAHLVGGGLCPQNTDNLIAGIGGVTYSGALAVTLGFAPVPAMGPFNSFRINNASPGRLCAHIRVDKCLGPAGLIGGGDRSDHNTLAGSVFPNPTTSEAVFSSPHESLKGARLAVSDCSGRILRQLTLPQEDVYEWPLGVAALGPGMYLLTVNTGTTKRRYKFIKNQ